MKKYKDVTAEEQFQEMFDFYRKDTGIMFKVIKELEKAFKENDKKTIIKLVKELKSGFLAEGIRGIKFNCSSQKIKSNDGKTCFVDTIVDINREDAMIWHVYNSLCVMAEVAFVLSTVPIGKELIISLMPNGKKWAKTCYGYEMTIENCAILLEKLIEEAYGDGGTFDQMEEKLKKGEWKI